MSGTPEQIDSKGPLYHKWRRRSSLHSWLKKLKARYERRKANRDPEAQSTYGKFQGWEL